MKQESSRNSQAMDDTAKKATAARSNGAPSPAPRQPPRAELVWEGKYDGAGRRVAPLRVALPFQTVETVNESAQDRQRCLGHPARYNRNTITES